MIQLNSNKMVRVELTTKEQKTVLKYCQSIDRDIYDRIMNSSNGVLHLLIEDCHYLKGCIQLELDRITIPKIQTILGKVFNKLSTNPITRNIAEEIEKQDFDNIDDLNDHLQGFMQNRNTAPDPEMGGLSPEQVSSLIYLDWDNDNFPLKFDSALKLSDLKHSSFFTNTTIFLNTLLEMENEKTATATGNLNRKFIKAVFDKLILERDYKETILRYNKVLNEDDVLPLSIIRIVCEGADLIDRKSNKFRVVKKYSNLLSEEKAGQLYHLLFISYFRKFNLSYSDRLPELDCLQQTIAYPIFRIGEICKDYQNLEDLPEAILLPAVLQEVKEEIPNRTYIEWLLGSRIIVPCVELGLLECIYNKEEKGVSEIVKVRKSKLFDKFIRFKF
jgi:hypothetical protein